MTVRVCICVNNVLVMYNPLTTVACIFWINFLIFDYKNVLCINLEVVEIAVSYKYILKYLYCTKKQLISKSLSRTLTCSVELRWIKAQSLFISFE